MNMNYKIQDMFRDAFGIAPAFTLPYTARDSAPISYSGGKELPEYYTPTLDIKTTPNWMGAYILFPAKFKEGGYYKYSATGKLEMVSKSDFYLPPATMFSFKRSKNIERTNLLGNNGSIKEIFSFDDWIIDVKGFCLNDKESSAQEKLKALLEWEELADGIGISGELFSQIKVDTVTINDWSHNTLQGGDGNVAFQFQMFSDESKE